MTIDTRIKRDFTDAELDTYLNSFIGLLSTPEVRAEITAWLQARVSVIVTVTEK